MRIVFVLVCALTLTGCKDSSSKAREAAREAEGTARSGAREASSTARDVYAAGRDAVALGRTVKTELDKVYKTDRDYDLAITRAGASTEHAAKLSTMPHVKVGAVTVGYEESTTRSLHGISYAKHFRATWRRGNEDVIVSYATQENIDVVAFAKLVEKMVPIVEKSID